MSIYDQSYPPSLWGGGALRGAVPAEDEEQHELPADIAHFTIDETKEWVGDDPERAADALEAEQARGDDARVTLVSWLETHNTTEEPTP